MYVPTVGLQFLVNAIVNQAIVESAALEVITVVLIDDCLTAWLLDSSNADLVILPSYFFFSRWRLVKLEQLDSLFENLWSWDQITNAEVLRTGAAKRREIMSGVSERKKEVRWQAAMPQ